MTFYPNQGLWATDQFNETGGGELAASPVQQNIINGYVALLPQIEKTVSYFNKWQAVSGWTINNGLTTYVNVTGTFYVTGGNSSTAQYAGITGYQTQTYAAGPWEVYTPHPSGSGMNLTGACFQYFALHSGSPDKRFFSGTQPTNYPFTLEFDVASIYPITGATFGYGTGTHTLSGLTKLSGQPINHGVFISDGVYWDYLECNPEGIRSYNHPELGLGIDLYQPKRFRVGVDSQNIFILAENGNGIAGIGKFNTPVYTANTGRPVLAFGAPDYTGNSYFSFRTGSSLGETGYIGSNPGSTIYGIAGHSYWDNIKLLTGRLALDFPTGVEKVYSTTVRSFYTAPFIPGINIAQWVEANIVYEDYPGGTTTVYPMYRTSGVYIPVTGLAVVISGGSSKRMSLATLPIVSNNYALSGMDRAHFSGELYNAIKFRIDQNSTNGRGLCPIVDSISIRAIKDIPILDMEPNWAPLDRATQVKMAVKRDLFLNSPPSPEPFDTFFFRANVNTGEIFTGVFTELSRRALRGSVIGTGFINQFGPNNVSYQNYAYVSGYATSGSAAGILFGSDPLYNFVPDPTFDLAFKAVNTLSTFSSNNLTGKLFGELGQYLYIPTSYTGETSMVLSKTRVRRTNSDDLTPNYAQNVLLVNSALSNNCGITVWIPSGISAPSNGAIFSFDLKIVQGSGVAINSPTLPFPSPIICDSSRFTDFKNIAVDFPATGFNKEFYISIVGYTGHSGPTEFIIDNLKLQSFTKSYLYMTGVPTYTHAVGTTNLTGKANQLANRASTVFSTDIFLDAYPTGNNVVFSKKRVSDNKGFTVSINPDGTPVVTYEMVHDAWYSGYVTGTQYFVDGGPFATGADVPVGTYTVTGLSKMPVGVWTNLAFIHQVWNHTNFANRSASGQWMMGNHAACNRIYLAINGMPIASQDGLTGWRTYKSNSFLGTSDIDATPFATMIADGSGIVTVASGLFCKIDNTILSRPPAADLESEVYIKASRNCPPYFGADVHLKPAHLLQDFSCVPSPYVGISGTSSTVATNLQDFLVALNDSGASPFNLLPYSHSCSIYTFDNPKLLTHWDHGCIKNHLLYFGDNIYKDLYNPHFMDDISSTRFGESSYARANYSSSLERLINDTGAWSDLRPSYPVVSAPGGAGRLYVGGWFYARNTGQLFSISEYALSGSDYRAISLTVTTTGIRFHKLSSSGTDSLLSFYTTSGNPLSGWQHVDLFYNWKGSDNYSTYTGYLSVNGYTSGIPFTTGSGIGFNYNPNSATFFAKGCDVNLSDWYMAADPLNYAEYYSTPFINISGLLTTHNKGGVYTKLRQNTTILSGYTGIPESQYILNLNLMTTILPPQNSGDVNLWIGTNNYEAEELPGVAGCALYASNPFKIAEHYVFRYNDRVLTNVFGATDSPIRVGALVPEHAINLARFDSPEYNSDAAVSTINLADSNSNNLLAYKGGKFTINKSNQTQTGTMASGSYMGVNSGRYIGQGDIIFTSQVDTDDIRITSLSAADKNLTQPSELFYSYLIGRGNWGIQINDYVPNTSGSMAVNTTGAPANNYIYNLTRLKKAITLTNSTGGQIIDTSWNIVPSPYNAKILEQAALSGKNLPIDGIGTGSYSGSALPSGIYSVILLIDSIPTSTLWVNYPGYRFTDGYTETRKEIVNPIPAMRERTVYQDPQAGQYFIAPGIDNKSYDIRIYGVYSGFTGMFSV